MELTNRLMLENITRSNEDITALQFNGDEAFMISNHETMMKTPVNKNKMRQQRNRTTIKPSSIMCEVSPGGGTSFSKKKKNKYHLKLNNH